MPKQRNVSPKDFNIVVRDANQFAGDTVQHDEMTMVVVKVR